MKSTKSQRYQDLMEDYIFLRKSVDNSVESGIIKAELTEQELSAINTYISSNSYKINEKLRSGSELSIQEKEFVNNLDNALKKLPIYQGIVYRSLSSDMIEDIASFWNLHQPGNLVKYPAYTSSSLEVYDDKMDIQCVIQSKQGKNITYYNSNEKEILFARNSNFFIREVRGNTIYGRGVKYGI